jgi:hypothetical protein
MGLIIPLRAAPRTEDTVSAPTAADGGVLSFEHEQELRRYFALDLPEPCGSSSTFGAMCDRVANSRNTKTSELPSPGASWTEILDCHLQQMSVRPDRAEDVFIAYIDMRRSVARVHAALAKLSERDRDVLHARYADDDCELDWLTPTAERENRERAAGGRHESVAETVASVHRDAKDVRAAKSVRDVARAKVTAMRRESAEVLRAARARYGHARRAPR